MLLATLLALAVVSGLLWYFNDEELDPSKVELRPAVAVLGFHNVTGREDSDWIEDALTEMLTLELGRGGTLRGVTAQAVEDARLQLDWTLGNPLPADELSGVRGLVGCDYAVSGAFVALPGGDEKLRLDLHVQDAVRGETVSQITREGTTGDLFRMVADAGSEILDALGGSLASESESGLPKNRRAARLFAEGTAALQAFQAEQARDLFQQAVAEEPGNALLHSSLSASWNALGFAQQAAEEAERAFELSEGLSYETRLLIEGRYREMQGDWNAARDVYRNLWVTFPDQLDYGLGLVAAQVESGDPGSALLTVDQLRRLPPPLSDDPRLDMKEAEAAAAAAQIERQATAAERAVQKAEQLGSYLLSAKALLTLSQAERMLGDSIPAASSASRALEIFRELGHEPGQAEALSALAGAELDRGQVDAARDGFREALETYRRLGYRGGQASVINNLAVLQKRAGDLDDALSLYAQAEAIYEEIGFERGIALAANNRGVLLVDRDRLDEAEPLLRRALETWKDDAGPARAFALNNVAELLRLRGETAESRRLHEEALTLRQQAGLRLDEVISLVNLGTLDLWTGDMEQADLRLEQALSKARDLDDPFTTAWALYFYAELQRERGDPALARDSHQEALDLRRELDQRGLVDSSRIALARLALEGGDFDGAAAMADEARLSCRLDSRRAEEIAAAAVQIEALAALGRIHDAEQLVAETRPLAEETSQPLIRADFLRSRAVLTGLSNSRAAAQTVQQMLSEVESLEIAKLTWELQLALAETGAADTAEDRAAMRRLGEDLERRGYGRLQGRALLASGT